ncbi:hypothetical protein [uncultured Frigoribacterium sp.]|uniref:hypothetical protein n=1 Tax=uncultured Frigoribacterium sp. TaxID=335377 RepID=UPI0028D73125|nr:hypothetical protein [uncultured Frigoribacterium sp.]
MTVWTVIAFAAVAAAVLAMLAPHARTSSVEALRLFRLQTVDNEASRRAATWALTPLAALSIGVSLIGLAVNEGGPGSGVTSLIALLLVGAGLAASHVAARRAKKVEASRRWPGNRAR